MEWVKLGDVAEIQMGVSPSSSSYNETGEGLPFYQGVADFGEIYPNERVYTTEAKRIANEGDILIGVRAPVGKVNINKKKSSIGRGLASLKSKDSNLNNKFIFYQLKKMESYFELNSTGSTFKAINKNIIESAPFVVYEAEHNIKIVKKLDMISELISTRKAQIAALDELVQSVFYEMFGDPLINNLEYQVVKLNKVSDVRDGTHDSPKYINEGYPLLTSKNVTSDGLILDSVNYISEEDFIKINKRSEVNNGDIIMPMIGTVGRPYIVNEDFDFAIKNLALIKLGDELLNVYLKYLLSERYIGAKFELKGGTQKFISLKLLRNLEIPLPPLEVQEQFAAKVEAIEAQKAKLQASLEEMEILFDALMQEAFSGNLG